MSTISRDDLEAKARQLVGTVEDTTQSAKQASMMLALAAVGVTLAAFYFGRRKGKSNKTLVEVYKV